VCSGSHDGFKFWEISDDMLETVLDRDSCSARLIGNHFRVALLFVTLNDPEGDFCCLKPF